MPQSILVSACLIGDAVRYDGGDKLCDHPIFRRWRSEGRVVPVCPEVAGGLPVPRLPAEIVGGVGGRKVLQGDVKVVDSHGRDVSPAFTRGADEALARAQRHGIRVAVMKEGSPSCGSGYIYDGRFNGTRRPEVGVTVARLQDAGITVFSEHQLAEADALLRQLDAPD